MAAPEMLRRRAVRCLFAVCVATPSALHAAVLPEDRADVMYHGYDGGGLEVNGPSVLVRKGYKDKVSAWANYYVDMITSASIDVVSTASPYDETRTEMSAGIDYLHGRTTMSASFLNSDESDYTSNNASVGISQDFFGDLTTLALSYAYGWDEVRKNGQDDFREDTERQTYRVALSQVLTKNLVMGINYEGVTDEGYLNNPYRSVRYLDPSSAKGYSYEAEVYPRTRTSGATSLRFMYYLPYRASVRVDARYYSDTWSIEAYNGEVRYTHPFEEWDVTLDVHYRYYDQTAADFYSDLYPRQQAQNFLARDKELASFTTQTVGVGASYEFSTARVPFFKKGEASLFVDYIMFSYDDFRDVTESGAPGEEPLYEFESTVLRAFVSFWF